jgi:hypothetical protein
MVSQLLKNRWIDVDQRGPGGKFPLQVAWEVGLWPQLSEVIIRGRLKNYIITIRDEAKSLMQRLHRQILNKLWDFLEDPSICVSDYRHCPIDQLIDVNRRMINYLLHRLGININDYFEGFVDQLLAVDANMELYKECVKQGDSAALPQIFPRFKFVNKIRPAPNAPDIVQDFNEMMLERHFSM